jgi:hypothetical protein
VPDTLTQPGSESPHKPHRQTLTPRSGQETGTELKTLADRKLRPDYRLCVLRGMTGRFATPEAGNSNESAGDYGFLHLAAASALRWRTGQFPCRKTGALRLRPYRMAVAAERSMEYTAMSIGCKARLALLTALGVTARFTARPGCMARRTLRGTSNLEKKPTRHPKAMKWLCGETTPAGIPAPINTASKAGRPTRLLRQELQPNRHPLPRLVSVL